MDCIEKQEPTLCCLQETHLAPKDNPNLMSKDLEQDTKQMENEQNQGYLYLYQQSEHYAKNN